MKNLIKQFVKEFDANYEDSTRPATKYAKTYALNSILDQLHYVIQTKHKDASKHHADAEEMISTSAGDTWEEIKSGKVMLVMGKVGETIGANHFDEYAFENKLILQANNTQEANMHQEVMNFFKDVFKQSTGEDYVPKDIRKSTVLSRQSTSQTVLNQFVTQATQKVA
jgi:hypothetical protein